MSQQGTIKRYSLIIKKVTESKYPSFADINSYLHTKSFEISSRTLQRDLRQLDDEFGLKITYDRDKNGYFISEKDQIQLEPFIRFLEIVDTSELLRESFSESKKTLQYISFDSSIKLTGIEWLKPLLMAIREQYIVSFEHQTFFEGPGKEFVIQPYLLKEYLNRWYLVGCFKGGKKLYNLGLDRISNLTVTSKKFKRDKKIVPQDNFKNIIGMVSSYNKLQKVTLSFTPEQGKYIKTLPLHSSQKIKVDNKNELRIELSIIPNYEFSQKILMHGSTVKVVKPKWLKNEIRDTLEETLNQYKD